MSDLNAEEKPLHVGAAGTCGVHIPGGVKEVMTDVQTWSENIGLAYRQGPRVVKYAVV